jgi:SAM-dependent methyltransferase
MKYRHKIKLPSGLTNGDWDQPHLEAVMTNLGDLRGKSVIDIGCLDGRWSFEMEARGAQVTSVDVVSLPTYLAAHRELGSMARYVTSRFEEYPVEGKFDLVWFCGVYYHLPDPIGAIKRLRQFADKAVIEGHILPGLSRNVESWVGEVYPTPDRCVDVSLIPTQFVLEQWVRSAGWRIESHTFDVANNRLALVCSAETLNA